MRGFLVTCSLLAALSGAAVAQDHSLTPEQQALVTKLRGILSSLHPQYGDVNVPGADLTLHLGKEFYYLPPDEAGNVLVNGWNNPNDAVSGQLGMVFPAGKNFVTSDWGAVVLFNAEGYIPSIEATPADFDRAAKAMRDAEDASNTARQKEGAVPIHFVGWAQPPLYDPVSHTVVWARDLKFGADQNDTLNYDVRTLGRRGSSVIRIIAPLSELKIIRPIANTLSRDAIFNPGSRYEDYNSNTDKKAAYGIAGMIAAGAGVVLAQKLGLLAVLALFAKKLIIVIVAALAAMIGRIRKMLGGKSSTKKVAIVSSQRLPPPESGDRP